MAYIANILVVAAFWLSLFGVATATPILKKTNGDGLAIPVTHNMNRTRNGPLEMYKAFRKFNIDIPDALEKIIHNQAPNKAALDQGKSDSSSMIPGPIS